MKVNELYKKQGLTDLRIRFNHNVGLQMRRRRNATD